MSTETADTPAPERYAALALQIATACVNSCPDRSAARALMAESLARVGASVAASKGFIRQFSGIEVKLVVLSVRCTPGPHIPGRPEADRIAVLHQFGRPGVHRDGTEVNGGLHNDAPPFDYY